MLKLTRFWFEFNPPDVKNLGLHLGCGVTAWTYDDAINKLETTVFNGQTIPPIKKAIENIDISTLEVNHIQPNTLIATTRGIWYPMGYN
jgi:hypothetical protein